MLNCTTPKRIESPSPPLSQLQKQRLRIRKQDAEPQTPTSKYEKSKKTKAKAKENVANQGKSPTEDKFPIERSDERVVPPSVPPHTNPPQQKASQITSEWTIQQPHLATFKSPALVKSLTDPRTKITSTTIVQAPKTKVESALTSPTSTTAPDPAPCTVAQKLRSTVAQFMDAERQQHIEVTSDFNDAEDTASSIESVISTAPTLRTSKETKEKPSLLPKPRVKVVIPPALLLHQQQQQQCQQQPQQEEQHELSLSTPSSRIPVRTANAERRVLKAAAAAEGIAAQVGVVGVENVVIAMGDRSPNVIQREQSPTNMTQSKAVINAEKRASWRAARLRSLEQGAQEAQDVIKNMNKIADDLLVAPVEVKKIVFPKIAIKSSDGPVIIREREKILDEKIVRRTEEVPCPLTGRPQLRTVEYIEKIIETEVETCQEKIISLELQDPESDDDDGSDSRNVKSSSPLTSSTYGASAKDAKTVAAAATQAIVVVADETLEDEEPPELLRETMLLDTVDEYDDDKDGDKVDKANDDNGDDDDYDEEEDAASIVTVHANNEKLFLRTDDEFATFDDFDGSGKFSTASIDSMASASKLRIQPMPIKIHQTLAKEVVVTAPMIPADRTLTSTHSSSPTKSETTTHTIVEVVNPLITGEGQVQSIVVGKTIEYEYPIFDNETQARLRPKGVEIQQAACIEDEHDNDSETEQLAAASAGVLRSDTFVLPTQEKQKNLQLLHQPPQELSLNAKMKNVLVELLENERVKLNLQKSLEEDDDEQQEMAYGDSDEDEDDEVDYAVARGTVIRGGTRLAPRGVGDNNGNERLLEELIKDSNRNTIEKLAGGLDDDESDADEDDDDEEEEEDSLDSSDSDDDAEAEDDEEAVNVTLVDGCQVIENRNTEAPLKLQKSQTYTTIKEAENVLDKSTTEATAELKYVDKDIEHTVEKLQAEQRKLEEITKQLRKSVENLLADDDAMAGAVCLKNEEGCGASTESPKQGISRTVETKTVIDEDGGKKTIVVETIHKADSKPKCSEQSQEESGEALFNKLLHAGGDLKQIFDQQTGESVITTTTTDPDGTVTTTTTTISNVIKSGIPRAVVLKSEASKTQGTTDAGAVGHDRGGQLPFETTVTTTMSSSVETAGSSKQSKQPSKQKRKGKQATSK